MIDENMPAPCRQVWDHAVEGRDVMSDPTLAAHVGSCVTCFRTLGELRDVPRIAATLRAGVPEVDVDARFLDDLATRTTNAAAVALRRPARNRAARVVGFVAMAAAAAAAVVLVAGRAPIVPAGGASRTAAATRTAAGVYDEATGDDPVDVADLDESALRRLLDRLRAGAPRNVAGLAAAGAGETTDIAFEDEGQMNEELAELDGAALLRLEHSLAGASL